MPPCPQVPRPHTFGALPGMGSPPLPWEAVPGPDHPFSEEIFPHTQPEPPLAQPGIVSSCPVTCSLGEGTNSQPPSSLKQRLAEADFPSLDPNIPSRCSCVLQPSLASPAGFLPCWIWSGIVLCSPAWLGHLGIHKGRGFWAHPFNKFISHTQTPL